MWRDQNLSGQFLGGISKTISESNGIQLKPVKTCWNIWTHTFFPSQVPCLDTVKIHINWECGENVEMSRKWYPCDLPCDLLWWSMMICYVEKVISLSLSRLLSSHWVLIALSIRLTEVCHLVVCRSRVLPEAWRPTRSSALSTQCTCCISLSNRYLVVI